MKRLICYSVLVLMFAGCVNTSQLARKQALPILQSNWQELKPYAGQDTATMDTLLIDGDYNLPSVWSVVRENVLTELRNHYDSGKIDLYLYQSRVEGVRIMDENVKQYGEVH